VRRLTLGELATTLGAFFSAGRFLRHMPHVSADEMRDWQWQRIVRLVRHAFETVPFYRERYRAAGFEPGDLTSWDAFRQLPLLTKDDVIANFPDRMIADGYRLDDLVVSRSSGSSGRPMDIAYDDHAMAIYMLAALRLYRMGFDYRPWHRQVYVYTSPYPLTSLFGLYPLSFVPTLAPIPEIIEVLRRTKPQLLVCYPSHLREIERALGPGEAAALRLRAISVNSEMSTQAERNALADRFGCPVLDEYSSEELTRIAAQCRSGTYHVFEDINLIEVLPEPTRSDGVGTIVGTNLHNLAMPMIRYAQNDLAAIGDAGPVCACGWRFRALTHLEGRRNDSFVMPSGRTLSSGFLLDATYEMLLTYRSEVRDFCLIQNTETAICLEIVPGAGWNPAVRAAIENRFRSFFEPGVRLDLREVEECEKTKSGKRNPIVSKVGRRASSPHEGRPGS
jgi:phenylacetate-CoA ligase